MIDYSRRGKASKRKGAVLCACGCGGRGSLITKKGDPRWFIHGHNARKDWGAMYVVEGRGYETPCWIWQGGTNEGGYGRTSYDGRMQPAHRVALLRQGIPVEAGMEVDHLCRVRACVNPEHLEVVSPLENIRRAARLTASDVEEIRAVRYWLVAADPVNIKGEPRRRCPDGSAVRAELATRYGITSNYVKQIWRDERWR